MRGHGYGYGVVGAASDRGFIAESTLLKSQTPLLIYSGMLKAPN
jgi:hypothetical protein